MSVDMRSVVTSANDQRLKRIEAATKVWAAGVEASPLGRRSREGTFERR